MKNSIFSAGTNRIALPVIALALLWPSLKASAQDAAGRHIQGTVYFQSDSNALPAVSIRILPENKTGQTDESGYFSVPLSSTSQKLVFAYPGMKTDTVLLSGQTTPLRVYLKGDKNTLKEVTIEGRLKPTEMDMLSTGNMQQIGSGELLKAACCNLSESFETTPSVDVGFTDAVSGYRQIQLLGLAGSNTAFTRENIPDVRGLAAVTGLTFTPGSWVESMQLSKGIGSVVNGYEGVAGQINVEWWKPFEKKTPRWYLNAYQSSQGRSEANVVYSHEFNKQLSTNLFLHGSGNWRQNDENHDGFLDNPLGKTFVGANRWFWFGKNGLEIQGGIKGVYLDHTGGQESYKKGQEIDSDAPWGYHQTLKRMEGWAKIGKVFVAKPWKSMGLQLSAAYHDQNSQYGLRAYKGNEKSFYANYIYQTIMGNTNNVFKTGASFSYSGFDEHFLGMPYRFSETVPGIFTEYSYKYLDKFGLVAGIRADYDNLYGSFITPRLHLRYAPAKNSVIRASVGRAQRTVAVFAENAGLLASNRQFVLNAGNDDAYGLKPEIAWNMGLSFLQKFRLNYRDGSFMMDYYYTHFQNQVVVDIEHPGEVRLYNLNGRSFAHSIQAQLDYEPVRKWDVRLAYRYYFVKTNYDGILKEKPLLAAQRAFLNTDYETRNHWKFDYTLNWNGKKRIPAYFLNHREIAGHYSPDFFQMNAQISKSWHNGNIEWYIGVENLTNYMQPDLIIGAAHPYQQGFDASMVWGPGMGRNFYTGIRWKLP
ncbi:MAG TPA: TonB-dependent receptor [Edaphocola sp.]|nr:TonB-dependent receptor [Edaphocola sp.]